MKNIVAIAFSLLSNFVLDAQDVKQDLLNRYFDVTTNEKEAFFVRLSKPYKQFWAYTDYDGKNRIVRVGFFTDSTFTTAIGPHSFYWDGVMLYKGNYVDGRPSDYWYFYNQKGMLYDSLHYAIATKKAILFPTNNKNEEEAEKNKSLLLQKEHLKKDTTTTFTVVEEEAKFPGGDKAWSKHILKQLSLPDMVMAINRPQKMTVEIQFVVCKDGEICSVEAINSSTPLLDIMAVNAIRRGPKWEPAFQAGKNVKAYRRQKISFIIPE